ncbi:MAG TPA: DUF3618 domain-containing protein [Lysobacter sp.]
MNTQDNIRTESQKDPAQLEREIDQKRNHIEQIVQELGNKLSPGEMFDRALQMGKGSGGEFAANLGQTVKANPVPALLAATGLIWLYSSSRSDTGAPTARPSAPPRSSADMSVYRTSAHGSTTTISTDTSMSGGASASGASHGVGEKASSAMHGMGEKLGAMKSGTGERLGSAKERVGATAHHAMDSVKYRASQAGDGFSHMLDTNPLAVGALGLAVGALLGAIVPRTRKEDELLGEYSDRLTDQARELARKGYDGVASATREMTDRAPGTTGMPQDRAAASSTAGSSGSPSGSLGSGSATAH